MSRPASPATVLHDVVVTNEQTRVSWHAGPASIEKGLIVVMPVRRRTMPDGLLGTDVTTFTIVAADGGNRMRRYDGVKFERDASKPPARFVFR